MNWRFGTVGATMFLQHLCAFWGVLTAGLGGAIARTELSNTQYVRSIIL